jgi:hypothetical protein
VKTKEYSPSVVAIIGGAKKAPPADAKPEKSEEEEDAGLSALGKALRLAVESKDDAAIGRALADAHEYCQPEAAEESE